MTDREKQFLTTENIAKKFKNQFKMVNTAIKRAEQLVYRGQAADENPALTVLDEIADGKDITVNEESDGPSQAPCGQ